MPLIQALNRGGTPHSTLVNVNPIGSCNRSDRLAKDNPLLRIEPWLGKNAV